MSIKLQDSNKFLPWIVCLTCGLFFFYEFIQMNMTNSLSTYLMQAFHVDGNQLGILSATYFDANLLFLFPAGIILDRFSTKKIVLITLGICIIGTALFAGSTSLAWASAYRFLTGIGSAFCFLSCMRLASVWFHDKQLALIVGLIMTLAFLGGTVAQAPLTLVINAYGWREAIYIDAFLGVLIFILIAIFVKDYPDYTAELREKRRLQLQEVGFWKSLKLSYLNWQNWLSGICTNMMNLPVFILGAIWGGVFLVQTQGYTHTEASIITGMIFIGTLVGSPVMGWFSDRIQRRKAPLIVGALLSLIIVTYIVYGSQHHFDTLIGLFFLLGFVSSAQIINYPLVAEKNASYLTATSVSVVSFNAIAGGAIFQPVVGWLLDKNWDGTMINNVRVYSVSDYHQAFFLLSLGFVIALVCLVFIKETFAKPKD
jgi:MFS family permease